MGIVAAIIVIGILVTVHELGHFVTAKMTGMRVDEFAIGFGKVLFSHRKGETVYSLRAIPLGGFNKIAGMEPDEPVTADGFNSKSIPARFLVIVAGAAMNFLLPVLIYTGISYCTGVEELLNEPILGNVQETRAAYAAGLRVGDRLLEINGKTVATWDDVVVAVKDSGEKEILVKAQRNGKVNEYRMLPQMNKELGRVIIGISPVFETKDIGIFAALQFGVKKTVATMYYMVNGLYQIAIGAAPADLSGPIGVAMVAGQVAEKGYLALLHFIAFLSINLGIVNLLPLPALDGGHAILLILEAVRGKPLSAKVMEYIQYAGISIIVAITVFSTYKDILRF